MATVAAPLPNLSQKQIARLLLLLESTQAMALRALEVLDDCDLQQLEVDVLRDIVELLPSIYEDVDVVSAHCRQLLALAVAMCGERLREVLDGRL